MREISLCKSCLKDCDFKPKKARKKLASLFAEDTKVELSSCLKVCPKRGVTFSIREFDGKQVLKSLRTFVSPENTLSETLLKIVKAARATA